MFIDADGSGRVHWKAINHDAIPEKYLITQLPPYRDTGMCCVENQGRTIHPQMQHPLEGGQGASPSWIPNSVIPEASALAAHREKGRKHDCTSLLTNPERVIPGSGSPQDAMLVSSTGRAPVAPLEHAGCQLCSLLLVGESSQGRSLCLPSQQAVPRQGAA